VQTGLGESTWMHKTKQTVPVNSNTMRICENKPMYNIGLGSLDFGHSTYPLGMLEIEN
jgi:hypothetical protein